jgi:predicted enzyme related to lactoylglutathione lyase
MTHAVVHFEIAGKDHAGLRRFYGDLFGWRLSDIAGMPYTMVEKEGEGIAGGIGQAPNGNPGHVTFYVSAEDPQATLDRAEELGGRTIMPVTELPQVTIALFADPEGHVVGIVKAP